MKKPKLTAEQNHARIAAAGAKDAAKKFKKSRAAVEKAMKDIRADATKNGAYLEGRKITMGEIMERAGKGPSYLYKKDASQDLKDLRKQVEDFIEEMTNAFPSNIHSVHRVVATRARDAQSELEMVRTNYALAELELSDAHADLQNKDKTIAVLETRVADLLKQLAGKTVVEMPTRRK